MTKSDLELVLEALVYSRPLAAHYPEPIARHERAVAVVIAAINKQREAEKFLPGTFEYHGCGEGAYWDKQGVRHDVTRSEAFALARADNLPMVTIDRLRVSSGYTHDWQRYLAT